MGKEVHLKNVNANKAEEMCIVYLSNHLHHHLKTIFSERVILWESASIEDQEIKLCVEQEKLSCCPLDAGQAGHNLLPTR